MGVWFNFLPALLITAALHAESPLALTAPAGGEAWALGTAHTLSWQTSQDIGPVKLRLYKDRLFLRWLSPELSRINAWNWTIPTDLTPGAGYQIVVHSSDYAYAATHASFFSITQGALALTSPNGGETWNIGEQGAIRWRSSLEPGSDIKLRLVRGNTLSEILGPPGENDGEWLWPVPPDFPPGENCRLFLYTPDYSFSDFSDASFRILRAPLRLITPNGGETYNRGGICTVLWDGDGTGQTQVKLKLYRNGQALEIISPAQANDGAWDWFIRENLAPGDGYRILIYTPDFQYMDLSNGDFNLD